VAENGCSATVKGMYECSATICTENGGTHPHCGRLLYLDHAGLPVWPCKGRDERRFKPGFLAPSTLRPAQRSYRLCGWNGHLRSWPIASIQKFERDCGTTWRECCAEFLKVSVIADGALAKSKTRRSVPVFQRRNRGQWLETSREDPAPAIAYRTALACRGLPTGCVTARAFRPIVLPDSGSHYASASLLLASLAVNRRAAAIDGFYGRPGGPGLRQTMQTVTGTYSLCSLSTG